MDHSLTRIGVFYDGNFFHVLNEYFTHHHSRRAQLSIHGLHELIRARVSVEEGVSARACRVVEAHYFRGRFGAEEAQRAAKLLPERQLEDALMREGVATHFLPMSAAGTEKGIDVWFALEAYERALERRFEVCVLVAGDSDYVPLVRKLCGLGTRVLLVGGDFEYVDSAGSRRSARTSRMLAREVSAWVALNGLLEDDSARSVVDGLFEEAPAPPAPGAPAVGHSPGRASGTIQNLIARDDQGKRYGFIVPEGGGEALWFGERDVDGVSFGDLSRGQTVRFEVGGNAQGACARQVRPAS